MHKSFILSKHFNISGNIRIVYFECLMLLFCCRLYIFCFYTAVCQTLCPKDVTILYKCTQFSLSPMLIPPSRADAEKSEREKKTWRLKNDVSSEKSGQNAGCMQSAVQSDSQFTERRQLCISVLCNRGNVR